MARSERMRAVLMLAEKAEEQAAQALKQFRDRLESEQGQLRQLQDYRSQYMDHYQAHRSGLRASDMISYTGFIQRLAQVIGDQESKLKQMDGELEQLQQTWQAQYHRRQSIEKLIARMKREENAATERRLQQELDELAAQQHWHKGGAF